MYGIYNIYYRVNTNWTFSIDFSPQASRSIYIISIFNASGLCIACRLFLFLYFRRKQDKPDARYKLINFIIIIIRRYLPLDRV